MADLPESIIAAEKIVERNKRLAALVTVAVIVAVAVLVLDFMIKNQIMAQVRAADKALKGGSDDTPEPSRFPPRGGDTDRNAGPVGRMGMVADTAMGTGSPPVGGPRPGTVGHRAGGPPVSTDSDGRRDENGASGAGGMAVPPDIEAHPPE
jgi:hypothetical protein